MDLFMMIIGWLKPESVLILEDIDQTSQLDQSFLTFIKNISKRTIFKSDDSQFDLIYTNSYIDLNRYNIINDGFVIGPTSLIDNIRFDKRYESVTIGNSIIIKKTIGTVEWIPKFYGIKKDDKISLSPIYLRNIPPPLETFDHCKFLKMIVSQIDECNYLEYGVGICSSVNAVKSVIPGTKCHCVDINNYPKEFTDSVNFYQMNTNQFSSNILPKIKFNVAFIDADHKAESAFKDFINIFKYAPSNSYIFLHDTYPYDPQLLNPLYCNDCHLTPLLIKGTYNQSCELLTLPFNPGFTIVRKL